MKSVSTHFINLIEAGQNTWCQEKSTAQCIRN